MRRSIRNNINKSVRSTPRAWTLEDGLTLHGRPRNVSYVGITEEIALDASCRVHRYFCASANHGGLTVPQAVLLRADELIQ